MTKIENIIRHLGKHGKVILKMDKQSGFYQLTVTKRKDDYLVGYQPGGRVARFNRADLRSVLVENSMFIESFR